MCYFGQVGVVGFMQCWGIDYFLQVGYLVLGVLQLIGGVVKWFYECCLGYGGDGFGYFYGSFGFGQQCFDGWIDMVGLDCVEVWQVGKIEQGIGGGYGYFQIIGLYVWYYF